jgi:hypothetical protein
LTIAEEADDIINGPRRESYGPVEQSFRRHALSWTAILLPKLTADITPSEAALMMAALKINREANTPNRDNRVDLIGYTLLVDKLEEGQPTSE